MLIRAKFKVLCPPGLFYMSRKLLSIKKKRKRCTLMQGLHFVLASVTAH